jgi:hypothetical protein
MGRPCKVCQHPQRDTIDRRLANGETDVCVGRDYALSQTNVFRHRVHHAKLPAATIVNQRRTAGTVALAAIRSLPTREEHYDEYRALGLRLDRLIKEGEAKRMPAMELAAIKEARTILDSTARLAGHVGTSSTPPALTVNLAVDVQIHAAVEQLLTRVALLIRLQSSNSNELLTMTQPTPLPDLVRRIAREALYHLSPSSWARRELDLNLDDWQKKVTDAPPGSRLIALTHRQAGKSSAGSVAVSHRMIYRSPGSTSLVLCPTQRQSQELIRKVRNILLTVNHKNLKSDNAFSLELKNGSRVLALPGENEATIRGLTVDGDLIVDEAARCLDPVV